MDSLSSEPISLIVEARSHGWRVDHFLSRTFANYSRALLQKSIEQQGVLVNGLPCKISKRLRVNDVVSVRLPRLPDETLPPEDLPIDILFEDEALIVLNKQAGMIVHPGKGNYRGTLAGALQFHFDSLSSIAGKLRPGIVHRLDRDTTGVIIVAKDNQVHHRLSEQFESRTVRKTYLAVVHGSVQRDSDYIETHMRVHSGNRQKMTVCEPGGNAREAVTYYEVAERFEAFSLVELFPKTGRTHQLRVHMRHIGHPIVADTLYGGHTPEELFAQEQFAQIQFTAESISPLDLPEEEDLDEANPPESGLADTAPIRRQALHAWKLEINHPLTGARLHFEAPLPDDMQNLIAALRRNKQEHRKKTT